MPALNAIFGADATPFAKELKKAEDIAGQSGKKIGSSLTDLGGFNWRTIGRELLVIFREIGRGNWARIPGSLSIVIAAMGEMAIAIGVIIAALGAAAYAGYKFISWLDRTDSAIRALNDQTAELKGRFESLANTLQKASDKAQEFQAWLRKVGEHSESISESTERELKALREQFEIEQKIAAAKGQTPAQKRSAEIAESEKELALVQKQIAAEKFLLDKNIEFAKKNESLSNNPKKAQALEGFEAAAKRANDILAEVSSYLTLQGVDLNEKSRRNEEQFNEPVPVKIGDKTEEVSYKAAKANADKWNDIVISNRSSQRELDDALASSKEAVEKHERSLRELTKEQENISSKINTEKNEPLDPGHAKFLKGHANALQSIGAYGAPAQVELLNVARRSEKHLASIDGKIGSAAHVGATAHGKTKY